MAATRPAAGPSSSQSEHIDLYGDLYADDEKVCLMLTLFIDVQKNAKFLIGLFCKKSQDGAVAHSLGTVLSSMLLFL